VRAWLRAVAATGANSPSTIAANYAMIGEANEAFTWLERAHRERDTGMVGLKADPRWDPLLSAPRFQDLLRRIGFPED